MPVIKRLLACGKRQNEQSKDEPQQSMQIAALQARSELLLSFLEERTCCLHVRFHVARRLLLPLVGVAVSCRLSIT